jgi:hypothetical protein
MDSKVEVGDFSITLKGEVFIDIRQDLFVVGGLHDLGEQESGPDSHEELRVRYGGGDMHAGGVMTTVQQAHTRVEGC